MNDTCEKCRNDIPELDLKGDPLIEIWGLIAQGFKLFAVKRMIDLGLTHKDAKLIAAHFNPEFGVCSCGYERLSGTGVTCPECKSFNYNLDVEPAFNRAFCNFLEYHLDFQQSDDERLKRFWCDGIDAFPNDLKDLFHSTLKEKKQIVTKCRVGNDGQTLYEMVIKFGDRSIQQYINRGSLIDCIPDSGQAEWVKVNPDIKTIEVRLF